MCIRDSIEGDGIGKDIWIASQMVFDSAISKSYDKKRKIQWKEVLAGEKANNIANSWLPQDTLDTISEYLIAIKGNIEFENNVIQTFTYFF